MTQLAPPADVGAVLPSTGIVARIRRLIVIGVVAAFAYPVFIGGKKGFCSGGLEAAGAFADGSGLPSEVAPQCISLQLVPNPLVFLALALIVLMTLGGLVRRGADESEAARVLQRASVALIAVVVVSIVVAQVWFALIPITEWTPDAGWLVVSPFPFASIEVTIEPMPVP